MRIDGTGRIIPGTNRSSGTPVRSGETFRPDSPNVQPRATQTSSLAAPSGIDALLALQAVDDATTGRRKAVKRANLLLDALEEIQADLLSGRVGESRLHRAMSLLTQAKSATDPALDGLIADIELRVRVELAKLGKYPPL